MATPAHLALLAADNLYLIFGERNEIQRLKHLQKLWSEDSTVFYVDDTHVLRTHQEISDHIASVLDSGPGFIFTELGTEIAAPHNLEGFATARLKWGFGPPGQPPVVTGHDILTIVNGKIERCYAFLDQK